MLRTFFLKRVTPLYVNIFLIFSFLFFWGCNSSTKPNTTPNVSNINVNLNIVRFEQELFAIDTLNYAAGFEALQKKYPDFFELFVEKLMTFGRLSDSSKRYYVPFKNFISNPDIRILNDSCQKKFADLNWLKPELEQAFKYYKYYLPKSPTPRQVFTHISAFGPAAITYDTTILGINLDNYLGNKFAIYEQVGIPRYLSRNYRPEFIMPNSLKAWLQGLYPKTEKESKLIDIMVYEGKLLYVLDLLMPTAPDSLKIGYRQKDIDWCFAEEANMWAFFIEKKLLYESDYKAYSKFINDSPTTSGMPSESPGRTSIWLGWQIVRKYMYEHPGTSIEKLLSIKDGQEILNQSKYKPKR